MSRTLVDEQRILRQLEDVDPMWLQRKRLPDARDRGLTHVAVFGQAARRPVRRIARRRFQRRRQDPFHVGIGDLPRHARPRLVEQAIQAAGQKSAAPFTDGLFRHVHVPRNRSRGFAASAPQHQPRAQGQRLGVVGRRAQRSSVSRSSVVSTIGVTGRPNRIGVSSL
jgi:hypothetical protein